MNNLAFQIYGSKKNTFQATWNTNLVETYNGFNAEILGSATGANWVGTTLTTGYTHTPGSTASLTSSNLAGLIVNYRITTTLTNVLAGSVTINFGGVSITGITSSTVIELLATTTGVFSITPTSDFQGTIAASGRSTSAPSNQLKLPLVSTGTYNFWIDWGDGTSDNITSWNQAQRIHTYASPGTYITRISGTIRGWESVNGNNHISDRKKLISVTSWGKLKPSTRAFDGCSNMTLNTVSDLLDLSHLTTMQFMFANCTNLTIINRSSEWNTSTITSLDNCFLSSTNFNSPLNGWDVSNVTNMGGMFSGCTNFNQNLNNWNVSKVTTFIGGPITAGMFSTCINFNNGFATGIPNQLTWTINTTSSVNMSNMFTFCSSFNSNLGTGTTPWDVSKVTSFANMFSNATKFNNGDETTLSKMNDWNINTVSNVVMNSMFQSANTFNRPIDNWYMTKVNNTSYMFYGNTAFNQSLSNWERVGSTLANVTVMSAMFYGCTNFNQNIGAWNVSNCLNFDGMFALCTNFNNGGSPDINNWRFKTSGNINMGGMFALCTNFNQPLNNWNTTRVTNMSGMFSGAGAFNQNIGAWDVSNWTSAGSMFYGASAFNNGGSPDINNWVMNTNPAVSLSFYQMFLEARSFNQPLYNWNTIRVTNMGGMFFSNGGNIFNNGNPAGVANVLPWNTSNVTSMSSMFITSWFNCDISSWDVSKVTDFSQMFYICTLFNNGGNPNINNWVLKSTGTINMGSMFRGCSTFNQPIGNWNMSRVTTVRYMFLGANTFNQSINGWNLGTCTALDFRFGSAFNNGFASGVGNTLSLTLNTTTPFYASEFCFGASSFNCDINGLDFTQCTNMSNMFGGAIKYNNGLTTGTAGVLTINTSNVTSMASMFNGCTSFNQDIGLFDVSKVTSFAAMFFNATLFNNGLDLTPINNWTLNTTVGANIDMNSMLGGNTGTKVFNRALNNWNTSEVTNMGSMFLNSGGTHSFNQPIDNWVMSKVTNTSNMFLGNTVFNQSLSNWERVGSTLANVTNMSSMFSSATLFNQNIGNWNVSGVTNFTGFMGTKTPSTLSSTNLDAIYNNTTGWVTRGVKPNIIISFGTAKYSQAGKTGKDTLTASPNNWIIVDGLLSVSTTSNNGGLIRVTTNPAHGFTASTAVYIYDVGGTTNANGTFTASVINTTQIELQASAYNAAYTSGGKVILG